ncbi:hypothetical protein IV203_023812 [Nitzschia inconspicua]|uniref:Uncharacterized protein n=1 Tax=Nitzschia inconspicua TaxID=303405 RepID=A0A9K3KBJ7_9STRA|nr:hypothetical protein IV203_023812 [Nitzschia inconspicua]
MSTSSRSPIVGSSSNLMLAAIVALTSYVPFEWMAKGSLLLCIVMFVVDPLPPVTRLFSIVSTLFVLLLTKWYRHVLAEREKEESMAMVDVVVPKEGQDDDVPTDNGERKKDK